MWGMMCGFWMCRCADENIKWVKIIALRVKKYYITVANKFTLVSTIINHLKLNLNINKSFIRTFAHPHICTFSFVHTFAHPHICTFSIIRTFAHPHICTFSFIRTSAHPHICTFSFIRTFAHLHICTFFFHSHICTSAYSHIS
ncbi:MAG: hypothetical protein JWR09_976 [Mucilaginibacter sp.]|nr:hypothetical protein [Mucilaginibacter sp.]